jgi:hypothetical protein
MSRWGGWVNASEEVLVRWNWDSPDRGHKHEGRQGEHGRS